MHFPGTSDNHFAPGYILPQCSRAVIFELGLTQTVSFHLLYVAQGFKSNLGNMVAPSVSYISYLSQ
jgi:hypothetical protein